MKRRALLAGLPFLALPHAVHAAARPCARCPGGVLGPPLPPPPPPPPPPGEVDVALTNLPTGLAELAVPGGDTVEVVVPASGTITVSVRAKFLLEGLWEVEEPGGFVQSRTALGAFQPLYTDLVGPNFFASRFIYRHPVDYPGTLLKGLNNGQMRMRLDPGPAGVLPPVVIDLVEWDITPTSPADLQALGVTPPVRSVLRSFAFPETVGISDYPIPVIEIPWNTRSLGLVRRSVFAQSVRVSLISTSGTLEIVPAV